MMAMSGFVSFAFSTRFKSVNRFCYDLPSLEFKQRTQALPNDFMVICD